MAIETERPTTATMALVAQLADALRARGERLVCAESCTGGLVAAACTALAGSSDWFDRGFVTYSNAAKCSSLGVPAELIARHGAVSEAVALAMAEGALAHSPARLALAVTGIAGPGGATPDKPVGTVWLAWGRRGAVQAECLQLGGDRQAVRAATVQQALARLVRAAQDTAPAGVVAAGVAKGPSAAQGPSQASPASALPVLLAGRFDAGEREAWQAELAARCPGVQWLDEAQALAAPGRVAAAVVANPPPGLLAQLPRLRLIQSLWAGVDKLLADPSLPAQVPLARMVDPAMNAAMAETALWAVLSLHRGFFDYQRQQAQALWQPLPQRRADEVPVRVLGRGQMGATTAARLAALGYPVRTWARGDGDLAEALATAHIVVNLLPLTHATRGLLNAQALAALPQGASLVNLARGAHLVDADLLAALDRGHLAHAVLDVFHTEPLPPDHPYWRHPRVTVLPHAAAATDLRSAASVVAANLHALQHGGVLAHTVDRARGY